MSFPFAAQTLITRDISEPIQRSDLLTVRVRRLGNSDDDGKCVILA